MLARPSSTYISQDHDMSASKHSRKITALYVYTMLGMGNPLKFKYNWIAEWLTKANREDFKEETELAERIVELGRDAKR